MTSSLPRLDRSQRQARLARRHHLAPVSRAADVGTAARSLIGLHSTDPATVYLSAWARIDGVTHADIDRALYDDRTVVKHMAMRRTVWALATCLVPVVQVAASDTIAAAERRRLTRDITRSGIRGDAAAWVAAAELAALEALADLGPTFGRDLSRAVPMLRTKITIGAGDKAQQVGAVTRVMTILSASGQVTRARAGGGWHERQPRWVRMQDWVPQITETSSMTAAGAQVELARWWLFAFGPATYDDLKWWTGWTVAQTKAALSAVGAVEVDLGDSGVGLVLADDLEPVADPDPWVALLPSLDPTTMAWKERDWYLGPHRGRLFDPYGNAGPTIWSDGRVVGGWGQRPGGQVVLEFLEDVGTETTRLVEDEAERLTGWLSGVQVRPSFPTPLQRELSGRAS